MEIGSKNKKISAYEYKGNWYVGIREWFQSKDDSWRPGSKGISLSIDEWNEFVNKFEDIKKEVSQQIQGEVASGTQG